MGLDLMNKASYNKNFFEAINSISPIGVGLGPDTPGYSENFFNFVGQ